MLKPGEVYLHIDPHNYGILVTYIEDGILTTEYMTAPSAIESIETEPVDWTGSGDQFNSIGPRYVLDDDPPLFI